MPSYNTNVASNNASTAALFRSIFSIARPILRKIISKTLIEDVGVLKDEVRVKAFEKNSELPILPLFADFENVEVVDAQSLENDMTNMPAFGWPLKDKASELIRKLNDESFQKEDQEGMLVMDVINFKFKLEFEQGYEIIFPVEGPLGVKCQLEIGTSKDMPRAWLELEVPRLRIWYVCHTQTIYLAFMGRPDLIPHIHVNADFGRGDIFNVSIKEEGPLDDVVERILSGFGPHEYLKSTQNNNNKRVSCMGDKVGQLIVKALSKFQNIGNGNPIEIKLKETILETIDTIVFFHENRSISHIDARIEKLEKELELERKAKELKTKELCQDEKIEESQYDQFVVESNSTVPKTESYFFCCGDLGFDNCLNENNVLEK